MSDTNNPSRNNNINTDNSASKPQEASLLDLLLIIARNRKLIITTTLICGALGLALFCLRSARAADADADFLVQNGLQTAATVAPTPAPSLAGDLKFDSRQNWQNFGRQQ